MMTKFLPSIFKVGFLSILILGLSQFANAQTVTINYYPTGSSGNIVAGQSTYHASESVYVEREIGSGNFTTFGTAINRIGFLLSSTTATALPVTLTGYQIYLKNTVASDSVFATGTYDLTGYTLVYSGSITVSTSADWTSINLSTPFVRTAGTNLKILILRNDALPSGGTGLVFIPSVGTGADASTQALTTSNRYNGTAAPAPNSTSLTATNFRPAIQLVNVPSADVTPTAFTLPSSSCYNSTQNISVTIKNNGGSTINAGAVSVKLTITGANTATLTQSSGGAITAGNTQNITFSGINLNTVGTNNVQVLTTMTGDGNNANDTLRTTLSTLTTYSSFPVLEDATVLTYFSHLQVIAGSGQWWGLVTGKYKNADLTDSLGAKAGNNFFMFNSYNGASGVIGRLYSRCFALPAGQPSANYNLNFWMSHDNSYSTYLDSMYVTVSTDKGVTWNRIAGFGRVDASFATPGWKVENVSLSAYAGQTIQIGFDGVGKYGNVIGIDEITVTANYPLPITLTNFSGVKEGSRNILNWATANETNNKGFELQRSANGEKFSSIASISSKAENGNSSSVLNYSYNDEKPLIGTNYYRLRQVDKDGKESFSNIVVLKSAFITKAEITRVYPNPVAEQLNVILNTPNSEKVNIRITDLVGKTIAEKALQTNQGDNNIQFNTSNLSRGTYLIRIISSNNSEMSIQKFIKQ
jgi:hypothetical protein